MKKYIFSYCFIFSIYTFNSLLAEDKTIYDPLKGSWHVIDPSELPSEAYGPPNEPNNGEFLVRIFNQYKVEQYYDHIITVSSGPWHTAAQCQDYTVLPKELFPDARCVAGYEATQIVTFNGFQDTETIKWERNFPYFSTCYKLPDPYGYTWEATALCTCGLRAFKWIYDNQYDPWIDNKNNFGDTLRCAVP